MNETTNRRKKTGLRSIVCGTRQGIAGIRGLARSMPVFDKMLRDYHLFYELPADKLLKKEESNSC